MLSALETGHLPNIVISLRQPSKTDLGYNKIEGKATVYVCRDPTCMYPTNNSERMLELLELTSVEKE